MGANIGTTTMKHNVKSKQLYFKRKNIMIMSIDMYKKPSYWRGLIESLRPYGDDELIKGIISKINHVEAFTKAKNHSVSKCLPLDMTIKTAETESGIEFSQYEYNEWLKSKYNTLDEYLESIA